MAGARQPTGLPPREPVGAAPLPPVRAVPHRRLSPTAAGALPRPARRKSGRDQPVPEQFEDGS